MKRSEEANLQRQKVDYWLFRTGGEKGLKANGYGGFGESNENVLKLILLMVHNSVTH